MNLRRAETLTFAEAAEVLRARWSRVVAVVGPSNAGKTSLIASIYDSFQRGPSGSVVFARSRTLHALELACHDARAASLRGVPHSPHTPHGEARFYHLEVRVDGAPEDIALLIGDRAGEEYREATDTPVVAQTYLEVRRADTIILLVDGRRLVDPLDRFNVKSEAILLLRGLVDGCATYPEQRLVIVLTKLDLLSDSPEPARPSDEFRQLVARAEAELSAAFASVDSVEVAACPTVSNSVKRGAGVSRLLSLMLRPPGTPDRPERELPPARRAFARLRVVGPNDEGGL